MASVFPYSFNYVAKTKAAFTQALSPTFSSANDTVRSFATIPPCIANGTTYAAGLLVALSITNKATLNWDLFDLATTNRVSTFGTASFPITGSLGLITPTDAQLSNCKVYPIQRLSPGFVTTYKVRNTGTDYCVIDGLNLHGLLGTPITVAITNGQELQDAAQTPRAIDPTFLVAQSESSYDAINSIHLRVYTSTLSSSGAATYHEMWLKRYSSASWATWSTNPEGCLAVDCFPWNVRRGDNGSVAILLGTGFTWDTSAHIWKCFRPRIAIINLSAGNSPTGQGNVLYASGEQGATDYANCMCTNQYGDIYIGGNLTAGAHVIERYAITDLTTPANSVTNHAILGSPVTSMTWDGARLIVSAATFGTSSINNIYYFDRSLTLLDSQTGITSPGQSGGSALPPIYFTRSAHPWMAQQY